jgi:transcriptional regulator with XRE-family HTH domain
MTTAVTRPRKPAADDFAVTAEDTLAHLREAITAARNEAGRLLACFRHAAGISQVQLAGRIGYSSTAVAHAELGRRPVSAEFWELVDVTLGAGGNLAGWGTRIKELTGALREEQRRLDQTRHAARVPRFLPPPGLHTTPSVSRAVPAPGAATPAAGRCPHCHQLVTLVTQIAAPPGPGTSEEPGRDPVPCLQALSDPR